MPPELNGTKFTTEKNKQTVAEHNFSRTFTRYKLEFRCQTRTINAKL